MVTWNLQTPKFVKLNVEQSACCSIALLLVDDVTFSLKHIKKVSYRKLCLSLILKVNAEFQGGVKMTESDWQWECQR